MRNAIVCVLLVAFAPVALAWEPEPVAGATPQLLYRLEFGGAALPVQALRLGLSGRGAPATPLLEGVVRDGGLDRVTLGGVDLLSRNVAMNENSGYFGKMMGIQWLGIGLGVIALGAIAIGLSGGGGNDAPATPGSGAG